MDFAYDQIAARTYSNDRSTTPKPSDENGANESSSTTPTRQPDRQNLQTEFQETFKAFSNSPWGTKLGGWWSTARTQGASYYETARKEAEKREAEAAKALEEARKIVVERTKTVVEAAEEQLDSIVNEERKAEEQQKKREQLSSETQEQEHSEKTETSKERDATTEQEDTETFLTRFKTEAAKRLKEVQQAEDAADEALLRFGSNIRNFLKDTISITAPEPSSTSNSSEVLFESKDATTGKRVIHTSRFEAQLHVIHTTPSSFTQDPDTSDQQWETFKDGFDIEKETDAIAKDLEKYPELRNAMEKYVPEQVDYKNFWTRYYFMRHVVGMQEEKRKELLKASTVDQEEEVGWDEDSDTEEQTQPAIKTATSTTKPTFNTPPSATIASTTAAEDQTHPQNPTTALHTRTDSDAITLKVPRRSHDEKSVADSEASYDLVSGAASHANSSPKQKVSKADEDSDDDWE